MVIPLIRIQNPKNELEKPFSGFFEPTSTAPTTRYGGRTIRTICETDSEARALVGQISLLGEEVEAPGSYAASALQNQR